MAPRLSSCMSRNIARVLLPAPDPMLIAAWGASSARDTSVMAPFFPAPTMRVSGSAAATAACTSAQVTSDGGGCDRVNVTNGALPSLDQAASGVSIPVLDETAV